MSIQSEIESLLEFEQKCCICHGTGVATLPATLPSSGRRPRCHNCKGAGSITTDLGDKLLEFLERHGKDLE